MKVTVCGSRDGRAEFQVSVASVAKMCLAERKGLIRDNATVLYP